MDRAQKNLQSIFELIFSWLLGPYRVDFPKLSVLIHFYVYLHLKTSLSLCGYACHILSRYFLYLKFMKNKLHQQWHQFIQKEPLMGNDLKLSQNNWKLFVNQCEKGMSLISNLHNQIISKCNNPLVILNEKEFSWKFP